MRNAAPTGMLALPFVLLMGSLALVLTAARAPQGDGRARVELELAGILPLPEEPAGILVLREKGKETLLPLLVPDGRVFTQRASEDGLLGRAIVALGAQVAEVDAVPSESVALALAQGVPIVSTRRLLDEEGLTPEDLARARGRARGRDMPRLWRPRLAARG